MAMASIIDGRARTFQAGAAIAQHLRVKLSAGKLAVAGAADADGIGTVAKEAFAADEHVAVNLKNAQGTVLMVASGAITAGVEVFAAAGGKIAAAGTVSVGRALTAATADNDYVEVLCP